MKNQASIGIRRPITDVFILATDHIDASLGLPSHLSERPLRGSQD